MTEENKIIQDAAQQKEEENAGYSDKSLVNVLAFIAAFLFVVGLGYFAYKYFLTNNTNTLQRFLNNTSQEANVDLPEVNVETQMQEIEEKKGDILAGASDVRENIQKEIDEALDEKEQTTNEQISDTTKPVEQQKYPVPSKLTTPASTTTPAATYWTANNYNNGDIQKGSYTVKAGDTLWEIAEGVYGDGSMWMNIANANSSQVGFAANGQQSLIYAGQVLTL